MNPRLRALKTILWTLLGILGAVSVARFTNGLGSSTGLTDAAPWGFWIAFDVMAGVALAAGGFVLAATVYIFHLERYRALVRPAILTALLGYVAVTAGLLYDLGLPWHIWHPLVHPQVHSVLFEVAVCVMLYLTVLLLEFSPVILEHPRFDRPLYRAAHRVLKRASIPLVIAGIVLSTLHQSSLGSLFLITPHRLHPLWYSPIIWILFFVSAAGLGLMMVTLESFFSAWFFGHQLRPRIVQGLARAGAVVLLLYAGLRVGDLAVRGLLGAAFDGSFEANLFLFELTLSAVVPGVLLLIPAVRRRLAGVGTLAFVAVAGLIGYRFDVCIVAFARPEGLPYFPTWMELAVSLGVVAGALLLFIFAVEKLKVYPSETGAATDPGPLRVPGARTVAGVWSLLPESLAAPTRDSLAALVGAAIAISLLPEDALLGARPAPSPVFEPRTVEGLLLERPSGSGHDFLIPAGEGAPVPDGARTPLLVLDGNRNGRLVLFAHQHHVAKLGDDDSCVLCHHQNRPFQKNSECHLCHLDMYSPTDNFDHSSHVSELGGNLGCSKCHRDSAEVKTRETARACLDCHEAMLVAGSRIPPPEQGLTGQACGYMQAMHGLCIECHQEQVEQQPDQFVPEFAQCFHCHRAVTGSILKQLPPYLIKDPSKA